jgi:hypothetical protein
MKANKIQLGRIRGKKHYIWRIKSVAWLRNYLAETDFSKWPKREDFQIKLTINHSFD